MCPFLELDRGGYELWSSDCTVPPTLRVSRGQDVFEF